MLRLLVASGATDIVVCDHLGAVHLGRKDMDEGKRWIAEHTNPGSYAGDLRGALHGALHGADVFIGLSVPGILTGDDIATMASDAIVFALANPDPEVAPEAAREHAAVVATGPSDYPNQINNVLVFVGAENPVHCSDQQSCSASRLGVMITDHVPSVCVTSDHATSYVVAAVAA